MGLNCSSLFSKKKSKINKRVEYSPRTAEKMYIARQTGKLIYPPLSSLLKEEPQRSLRPDDGILYEPTYMDAEASPRYDNEQYRGTSSFGNYHKQYDDGTFTVLSSQPMNSCHIFRL